MRTHQFHITEEDAGRRVDDYLASRLGGISRMRIASLIGRGACMVNGAPAPPGHHLASGDRVEITLEDMAPTAMSPEPIPLEVLHEDAHLIVVVKPAGMLVHPTLSVKSGTLANALAYHLNRSQISNLEFEAGAPITRPGIVHRLDRATSGLMVVAKTPRALTVLSRHFHRRLVEKRYLALVWGHMAQERGAIVAPIGRDPGRRPQWSVTGSGKAAETRFLVLERFEGAELVELEPVTGRTNQLRIHCAYLGHPILGDDLYDSRLQVIADREQGADLGSEISNLGSEIPECPVPCNLSPVTYPRLCLHAHRLAFHHPATGEWVEFASPLPGDWPEVSDRPSGV